MIVSLSVNAERDLEAVGDYIARDDPIRALSFLGELRAKCLGLADFPDRFPLVPRYEHRGIRHRVHGNYVIFYRVEADRVVILHVLSGARDYAEILS